MLAYLMSNLTTILFGTIYPAYSSFKAIKTKNFKEYENWMMYWTTFAISTTLFIFTDFLLSFWFPFYYELKIFYVLFLLTPTINDNHGGNGGTLIYKNVLHPFLVKNEGWIDENLKDLEEWGLGLIGEWSWWGVGVLKGAVMRNLGRLEEIEVIRRNIAKIYEPGRRGIKSLQIEGVPEDSTSGLDLDLGFNHGRKLRKRRSHAKSKSKSSQGSSRREYHNLHNNGEIPVDNDDNIKMETDSSCSQQSSPEVFHTYDHDATSTYEIKIKKTPRPRRRHKKEDK